MIDLYAVPLLQEHLAKADPGTTAEEVLHKLATAAKLDLFAASGIVAGVDNEDIGVEIHAGLVNVLERACTAVQDIEEILNDAETMGKLDPHVELERRYGELLAGSDDDFDAACELLDQAVKAPLASVSGVAVMARILITSTTSGRSCWDRAAASAILEWVGRQTGRNEFIGAANFEKVGVEAGAEERAKRAA